MKRIALTLLGTLIGGSAWCATEERTSMPAHCSERSANCVVDDGPAAPSRAAPAQRDPPLPLRPTLTPLPQGPMMPRGTAPAAATHEGGAARGGRR